MKKIFAAAVALMSLNAMAGGNVDAGKAAAEKYNCASCHGKDFNRPIDPSYPKLAGQHQDYLEHALVSYQRGADGANGRGNAIMGAQAKALSKKDIQDIAAYLHSLPTSLVLRK
ncbi:c-type cytochrome [Noviherbaspirillum galbum]|uniref:Cytochrome c n=1 Tax=Noviherbaspirillum galbum TaxID=2709383 RepID=A0A6B3SK51_9BURK|nr:cytochrome c [Noviherbaspirillum galbum]NEX61181.1 cytochrome c [Noviherbaspirillum galbum]